MKAAYICSHQGKDKKLGDFSLKAQLNFQAGKLATSFQLIELINYDVVSIMPSITSQLLIYGKTITHNLKLVIRFAKAYDPSLLLIMSKKIGLNHMFIINWDLHNEIKKSHLSDSVLISKQLHNNPPTDTKLFRTKY